MDAGGEIDMAEGMMLRYGALLALLLLAFSISTGSSTSDHPGTGADGIADAPREEFSGRANVTEDSEALDAVNGKSPEDTNVENVESGASSGSGSDLEIPMGGGASKIPIPVPKASSNGEIPPISVLLNKPVWLEIENRTLEGSSPFGRLVVNFLPIGSPDFNRLIEDSGYAKVREFENVSGSCSWWEDPRAPRLPYKEDDPVQGAETLQVNRFYVGWAYSNTYHYPDCRWARNIPLGSQVWFSSPEEAKAAGYVPCSTCNPP